ncbi:MAG: Holliday junction branch migration protein RuvA [Rubrobacteridae bacterium]|nr:Holliday junction branch migration protein RuvA [Rubrobacteridae bacterium]
MIAFLKGKLEDKGAGFVDIDVNGVGYRAFLSNNSLSAIPHRGEPVFVYTHTYVREDLIQLFGFHSTAEREVFEKLISVSGIGPKVALAVLSVFEVNALKQAIASEDIALISSVPGIGKKSAQRLILELKDKLSLPDIDALVVPSVKDASMYEEARGALISLGYTNAEVKKALSGYSGESEISVELLVKFALKNLMKV